MSKRNIIFAVAALLFSLPLFVSSASVEAKSNGQQYVPYITDLAGQSSGDVAGFNSDILPSGSSTSFVNGNFDANNIKCDETTFCAARSPKHSQAVAPICAWNTCAYIDNNSDKDIFVPFRTSQEWNAFLETAQNNGSLNVRITQAAIPTTFAGGPTETTVDAPYEGCDAQQTQTPTGFGRGEAQWVSATTQTFDCHKDARTGSHATVESNLNWVADAGGNWKRDFKFSPDVNLDVAEVGNNSNHGKDIEIDEGKSIVLSWTTHGAKGQSWKCNADGDWNGEQSWTGGHKTLVPHDGGNFKLSCKDNHGLKTDTNCTVHVKHKKGVCGTDNGQELTDKPTKLCGYDNVASEVCANDTGWDWTCTPKRGGDAAQCSAKRAYCPTPVDGQCGDVCGGTSVTKPLDHLCQVGMPSEVTGEGPWSWTCAGKDGGKDAHCKVNPPPSPKDGVCGASDGSITTTAPTTGLCDAGKASGVTGTGPWKWSCAGKDGGKTAYCSAKPPEPPCDAKCGPADGKQTSVAPKTDLCSVGLPSEVTGSGPWNWVCASQNGGKNAYCSAPKAPEPPEDGQCGPIDGKDVPSKPSADLCNKGMPSEVTGNNPWNWTCSGKNGGKQAYCSAHHNVPPPVNGYCGPANGTTVTAPPTTGLCSSGTPTLVTGNGPWHWSCLGSNGGTDSDCSANPPPPVDAECGPSNALFLDQAPTTGLCSVGSPTAVTGTGPWAWNCIGTNGGKPAYCAAYVTPPCNGKCGPKNGMTLTEAPTTGLCDAGTPGPVTGSGPWNWYCSGTHGGTTDYCKAFPPAPPINGICGSAINSDVYPTGNLCSSGVASAVSGNGPWSWTCSGINGGHGVSCATPPRNTGDSGNNGGDGGGGGDGGDGGG